MEDNLPYACYSFHIYSNLAVLNRFRDSKSRTTFSYHPHGGKDGNIENLWTSFIFAEDTYQGTELENIEKRNVDLYQHGHGYNSKSCISVSPAITVSNLITS